MVKVRVIIFLQLLALLSILRAQDTTDVAYLKTMEYLKYAYLVDCDSSLGSTLEERICLNLEFQKQDARMNQILMQILAKNLKEQDLFLSEHKEFIKRRRKESDAMSDGVIGNASGAVYLSKMLELTTERIALYQKILTKK